MSKEITLESALAKFVLDNLGDMNKQYAEQHGVKPKDEIDQFFACKKCGNVGCDCEIEQPQEEQ